MKRKCINCGNEKELSDFYKKEKWKTNSCKECCRKHSRVRYWKNPELNRKKAINYYHANREQRKLWHKKYEQRIKDAAFTKYGGFKCACCGETIRCFLTIDHINGGGTKHRKETGGGGRFYYRWLLKNNYPDGFRVLCFNCNSGRALNGGICPHEEIKKNIKEEAVVIN